MVNAEAVVKEFLATQDPRNTLGEVLVPGGKRKSVPTFLGKVDVYRSERAELVQKILARLAKEKWRIREVDHTNVTSVVRAYRDGESLFVSVCQRARSRSSEVSVETKKVPRWEVLDRAAKKSDAAKAIAKELLKRKRNNEFDVLLGGEIVAWHEPPPTSFDDLAAKIQSDRGTLIVAPYVNALPEERRAKLVTRFLEADPNFDLFAVALAPTDTVLQDVFIPRLVESLRDFTSKDPAYNAWFASRARELLDGRPLPADVRASSKMGTSVLDLIRGDNGNGAKKKKKKKPRLTSTRK
jgi:hypothetical protein